MDDNYRAAVDAAAIFSETDLRGNITYVNQQFCSISGYSREELLGANHRILNSGLHEPTFFCRHVAGFGRRAGVEGRNLQPVQGRFVVLGRQHHGATGRSADRPGAQVCVDPL